MGDPVPGAPNVFGRLKAFDPETENISTYLEGIKLYFEANNIVDEKKVPVLLTVIGPRNYGITRSLVAPTRPKDKTYVQLETALKAHFQPKPLVIAEHSRFYQRNQGPYRDSVGLCSRVATTSYHLRIWRLLG